MDGLKIAPSQISLTPERTISFPKADTSGGPSFKDTLKNAVQSVNELQVSSDKAMQELSTGKSQSLHETMIAAEKADISLRLMVQVRNKIIDAYNEVMKMQV